MIIVFAAVVVVMPEQHHDIVVGKLRTLHIPFFTARLPNTASRSSETWCNCSLSYSTLFSKLHGIVCLLVAGGSPQGFAYQASGFEPSAFKMCCPC